MYFQRHKPEIRLQLGLGLSLRLAIVYNSPLQKYASHFCGAIPRIAHSKPSRGVCLTVYLSHNYILKLFNHHSNFFPY